MQANRKEAIAKMQSALGEVIIDGIDTNIDYQYEILKDEDYQSGNFDTGFLASHIIAGVKINENKHMFKKTVRDIRGEEQENTPEVPDNLMRKCKPAKRRFL